MISRTEFEQGVSTENIRASQIIHIALALGVTMFFAVILFLYNTGSPQSNQDEDLIRLLCMVLLVFAMSAYGMASFIYNKMFASISLSEPAVSTGGTVIRNVGDSFVTKLRVAQIVRLALFEGVAFFGLTVCLLSVMDGVMLVRPIYWAAALPALFVVLLVAVTFPTKEKLGGAFVEYQEMSGNR